MRLRSWAIPWALLFLLVRCASGGQSSPDAAKSAISPDSALGGVDTAPPQDTPSPAVADSGPDTTPSQDTQNPTATDTGMVAADVPIPPADAGHAPDVAVDVAVDVAAAPDTSSPPDTAAGVMCNGTVYPSSGVVDPDDPQYSDSMYPAPQVKSMFEQAKAASSNAYWAYKAALKYPELLECGFCSCGCDSAPTNHMSAVDCFKDMHGFG